MRTVFLANSDPEQINILKNLIDWTKYDYRIVGTSDNGTKTMGEILRKQPDLIFINNALPGLAGIEIVERIHEHGLLCEFILVEDMADFELARKAMQLGVREFLINPVTSEEMVRVLHDFHDRYQAHHSRDIESYLVSTRRLLRNSFMRNFVSSEDHQHFSISELNKQYHFTLRDGLFQCALVQLRGLPKEEESTFLPAVAEELRFRFDPICYEMIPFVQGASRLTVILNYSPESDVKSRIGEIKDVIQTFLLEHNCASTSFAIGVGTACDDVNALLDALHSAERAAYSSIFQGANQMYFMDSLIFDSIRREDVITPEFTNELKISVEAMDLARYEKAIRKAFEKVTVRTDPEVIVHICREAIIEVAKARGDADAVTREEIRKVLYTVMNSSSISVIMTTLVKNAHLKLEAVKKEKELSRSIRKAMKYIKNNYSKDITLSDVADYVHLNASYLSMLFKKETGDNYIGYLTKCRIEEAKNLLKESSMSVADICNAVGYTDKKHFSRLFIKEVGIRPTAYRSLH